MTWKFNMCFLLDIVLVGCNSILFVITLSFSWTILDNDFYCIVFVLCLEPSCLDKKGNLWPWSWTIWPNRGDASCLLTWSLTGKGGHSLLSGEDLGSGMKQTMIGPQLSKDSAARSIISSICKCISHFYLLINPWYPLKQMLVDFS